MLLRILMFLALYCGTAVTALAPDPLGRSSQIVHDRRQACPSEIFADIGDAMMSDNRPIIVTIGTNAALDSTRYADPIKTNGRWVKQINPGSGSFDSPETWTSLASRGRLTR